jgi:diaminopimelate decarboxylase
MSASVNSRLAKAAAAIGTPAYVYDMDLVRARFETLRALFGRNFEISYAVKANPNIELLKRILPNVVTFDVSSYKEVERALDAGCPVERMTFSGPAKREPEIEGAISIHIGELVVESVAEAEVASAAAVRLGVTQDVLIRINPSTLPRHFGVNMAGKASQFGIDEEEIEAGIDAIKALPGLNLIGFHIYSGTNSLKAEAIAENYAIFIELFRRCSDHAGIAPRKLIFGSGFGVPYIDTDEPLDVEELAALTMPMIDEFKQDTRFAASACVLEMGRWLVGPAGWLLTGVIAEKRSRGVDIRMCDAGFNNHLAACGMMGSVIRRNWSFTNVTNPDAEPAKYNLVGPLCTTIDMLASNITLPAVRVNDVLAISNSGAYGLTASPTRFISHPEPAELIFDGAEVIDATESKLNHWRTIASQPTSRTLSDVA